MIRGNAMAALREIGKLEHLLEDLRALPRKVAIEAAPKISRLQTRQFATGTDPYGRTWRALKRSTLARGRRPPPLTDTQKLRSGTTARPLSSNRAGLVLRLGASYGYFHQVGFHVGRTTVGPRRILPQKGLPRAWREILNAAARKVARGAR